MASAASYAIIAQFDSTGANLNALTGGTVDIWLKTAVLP
jgi:hypothetical protein